MWSGLLCDSTQVSGFSLTLGLLAAQAAFVVRELSGALKAAYADGQADFVRVS